MDLKAKRRAYFDALHAEFERETDTKHVNGDGEVDIDYVIWLQDKLLRTSQKPETSDEALHIADVSNLVLLVKPNYKSKDGTIKRGIEIDGNFYAPQNDC